MGRRIQCRRPSPFRRLHGLRDGVARSGLDHGQRAISVRREGRSCAGVVSSGVRTIADGRNRQDFSRTRIHYRNHFVVANRKELVVRGINRQP